MIKILEWCACTKLDHPQAIVRDDEGFWELAIQHDRDGSNVRLYAAIYGPGDQYLRNAPDQRWRVTRYGRPIVIVCACVDLFSGSRLPSWRREEQIFRAWVERFSPTVQEMVDTIQMTEAL